MALMDRFVRCQSALVCQLPQIVLNGILTILIKYRSYRLVSCQYVRFGRPIKINTHETLAWPRMTLYREHAHPPDLSLKIGTPPPKRT